MALSKHDYYYYYCYCYYYYSYFKTSRNKATKITPKEKNVKKHGCNGNVNIDIHARQGGPP